EGQVIEAVADALAAYKADLQLFGYYSLTERGSHGYDISAIDKKNKDLRANLAAALWFTYLALQQEKADLPHDLIYRWLARNDTVNGTQRAFESGPVILEELLDVLDEKGFTGESDGDRNTTSRFEQKVIKAFEGRNGIYVPFIRGDADQSKQVDITDAIYILNYLFAGNVDERCLDAMDTDGDGQVILTDPVYLLNHQ